MHQNAEQNLEVEVNVKHSRIVFYCVFDVWGKVEAENLVLHLRIREVSVSRLECYSY